MKKIFNTFSNEVSANKIKAVLISQFHHKQNGYHQEKIKSKQNK